MLLEMNGAGIGHEGLYVTSLIERAMGWRDRADEFADRHHAAPLDACTHGTYRKRHEETPPNGATRWRG
jgi:hypothetical protein